MSTWEEIDREVIRSSLERLKMSASSYTHLDFVEIVAESNKEQGAFLVRFKRKGLIEECWIPYSVIADADDYRKGDVNGSISIKEWWSNKENVHN